MSAERTISKKNDETERAKGLGRQTRDEIGKGYRMTALRLNTWRGRRLGGGGGGGGHKTSLSPFGIIDTENAS